VIYITWSGAPLALHPSAADKLGRLQFRQEREGETIPYVSGAAFDRTKQYTVVGSAFGQDDYYKAIARLGDMKFAPNKLADLAQDITRQVLALLTKSESSVFDLSRGEYATRPLMRPQTGKERSKPLATGPMQQNYLGASISQAQA
jgi:hypothetical protein